MFGMFELQVPVVQKLDDCIFTISFVVISQKRKMLNLNTVQESGMELHDQRQTGANTTDYWKKGITSRKISPSTN